MSFQKPITIAEAMKKIDSNQYLLPAIQREFVWSSESIEWLFDSLMKGYPINSFLFWKVEGKTAKDYKFYRFISKYREKYKIHNEEFSTSNRDSFEAILDGQQRLTALYLGLKGSYAYKEPRKRWRDDEISIPTRHLYLNISNTLKDQEDDREYGFSFLEQKKTNEEELYISGEGKNKVYWFRVGKILNYKNDNEIDGFLEKNNLNKEISKKILKRLRVVITEDKTLNYFLEEEQDLNKALNIFIRINSGGERLNFSDLIMSIAVANWDKKNAREEIYSLVDNIRNKEFSITKDLVLKTFLYLYSKDIKFNINNFSRKNAEIFEKNWDKIRDAILSTFDLLRSFGFSDLHLISKNAILPIVYYLYHQDFMNKKQYKSERETIKKWLYLVLLKQVFGSSSDTRLTQIRQAFTDNIEKAPLNAGVDSFPIEFKALKNFSLYVDDEFIEELLRTQKEDKYSFLILSMLYPNLDYKSNSFHKDHLHPVSQFDELSEPDREHYNWEDYNSICNLQLLDANENTSKKHTPLEKWVKENAKKDRKLFLNNHLIPNVDLSINKFGKFFKKRKAILIKKLKNLLTD